MEYPTRWYFIKKVFRRSFCWLLERKEIGPLRLINNPMKVNITSGPKLANRLVRLGGELAVCVCVCVSSVPCGVAWWLSEFVCVTRLADFDSESQCLFQSYVRKDYVQIESNLRSRPFITLDRWSIFLASIEVWSASLLHLQANAFPSHLDNLCSGERRT